MIRWFSMMAILSALSGCATVPTPLRGDFSDVKPQQASERDLAGQRVRWGGDILEVTPGEDKTCFELLGRALNDEARPVLNDNGQGRFIACAPGFYDPAIYEEGRKLTVVGMLSTPVTREIGDYDYSYPRVSVEQLHLWSRQPVYAYARPPYYYDPFFYSPFYGPFGYSRFRSGLFGYSRFGSGFYW